MSDSRNWNGTGEQIKSALSEALQSGDFKNLNDLVSQTVADAISAAGKHVSPENTTKQRSSGAVFEDADAREQKQTDAPPNIPLWQQRAMERERQRQNRLMQE